LLQRRADGARAGDPSIFIDEYTINCTDEVDPGN
jgi:hypothetical protein